MQFNTRIPKVLKSYFDQELKDYLASMDSEDFTKAWSHLERAHIIGQKYPYHHSLVHWKMLKFGVRIKSWKEVIGQIPRLIVGGVKSFVGIIPEGNPGGANVPALKPFPIKEELQLILDKV